MPSPRCRPCFATAAAPPAAAVPAVPLPVYRERCCLSTSYACDVLGTCDSATWSPGGTDCEACARADASPVATAVVAVAATPPKAARTMVDTIFLERSFPVAAINHRL